MLNGIPVDGPNPHGMHSAGCPVTFQIPEKFVPRNRKSVSYPARIGATVGRDGVIRTSTPSPSAPSDGRNSARHPALMIERTRCACT